MIAFLLLLWQATPLPKVGDTVWVTRTVSLPPGTVARVPAWTPAGDVELLAPGTAIAHDGVVDLRFPVVIWSSGPHVIDVPGPVVLGANGSIDTVATTPISITIASVLPDSVHRDSVEARPPAPVLPPFETDPRPLVLWGGLGAVVALAIILARRQRRSPDVAIPTDVAPAEPPVERWVAAGEDRAASAIAALRLRMAIHRGFEPADPRLDTGAVLRLLEGSRPQWPVAEIRRVLGALDRVRFGASEGGGDVGPLIEDAARLARGLDGTT
ncbi:MAG: hypothetical protein ACREL2_03205 [Gemmatimonadales bacterium]